MSPMIVAYCLRLTFCRFIVSFVRSPYKFRYSPFLDVLLSSVLAFSGPRNDRRVAMYKRPACTSLQTSECSASAASLQTSLKLRIPPLSHLPYLPRTSTLNRATVPSCVRTPKPSFISFVFVLDRFRHQLLCRSAGTTYLTSLKISSSTNSLGATCTAPTRVSSLYR